MKTSYDTVFFFFLVLRTCELKRDVRLTALLFERNYANDVHLPPRTRDFRHALHAILSTAKEKSASSPVCLHQPSRSALPTFLTAHCLAFSLVIPSSPSFCLALETHATRSKAPSREHVTRGGPHAPTPLCSCFIVRTFHYLSESSRFLFCSLEHRNSWKTTPSLHKENSKTTPLTTTTKPQGTGREGEQKERRRVSQREKMHHATIQRGVKKRRQNRIKRSP
jgi:hypothetical protein